VGDATALSFSAVILTSLGAVVFLKERVGLRRWIAIAIGLAGTLIILRPGVQAVSQGSLMVLLSTMLWSCSLLIVKILSRTDSSVTIVFYSAVYFTPLSLIPALFVWQWPTVEQIALMVVIGVLASVAHLGMAQAFKEADATVVMPLDFTRLIWAAGVGYFVFGEFPDLWTWAGGAVIVASAVYIAYRESAAKPAVTVTDAPARDRIAQ
jgi:drug/metabolite transporter (DMT)-like permease